MKLVLVQLPVPKLNFGVNTGNIPLGPACLKQAVSDLPGCRAELLPGDLATYAGDGAIVAAVTERAPDVVGFTIFAWNRDRSVYLAEKLREKTGARIIFGGPEVTWDTVDRYPDFVDLCIPGEGESALRLVAEEADPWQNKTLDCPSDRSWLAKGSPYVNGHLPLGRDKVMLLETQRGCPYKCRFCYYSKSRKTRDVAGNPRVLEGLAWALDNGVEEIYLMDPSFNARPGLDGLLKEMAALNREGRISLTSEIRAESVTASRAAAYARAGFRSFEVGLQSTNPAALEIMNRPTRLDKFVDGVKALEQADITPTIDLIFGLPGDTPQGFRRTVDFILEHRMDRHVQVFPLLVLPGTVFRKRAQELGFVFSPHPPYPVFQTPGFPEAGMEASLDYAEDAFDRTFYPLPDLDLSHKGEDRYIRLGGMPCLAKLVLNHPRPDARALARSITSPFQIFFSQEACDPDYAAQVVANITAANPFVPLELVFETAEQLPDTDALLAAANTPRPHFLDQDLRWLYPDPGNRSLLFSLVTPRRELIFEGPMKRQIFLWHHSRLPDIADLEGLAHLDGILIRPGRDTDQIHAAIRRWQDEMADRHEEIVPVTFSDPGCQTRWLSLTQAGKYDFSLLQAMDKFRAPW